MICHRQADNATTNDDHVTRLCHSIPPPDAISSVTALGRGYYTMLQRPDGGHAGWAAREIRQPGVPAMTTMAVRAGLPKNSATRGSPLEQRWPAALGCH